MSIFKYAVCASQGAAKKEPVLCRADYISALKKAKNLGFEGLEIHVRDASEVDGRALLAAANEIGVQIVGIASGLAKRTDGLTLVHEDEAIRKMAIERLKGHLDLADYLGCPVVVGSMRDNIPSEEQTEVYLNRLRDSMQELADYIEDKNCLILLEAINRYENNYLNRADETVDFIKGIQSNKIKVLLDLYHMNIEERNNVEAIYTAGDYLGHVHVTENNRLAPGMGQIAIVPILQALQKIDYKGWLSFEYLPVPDEETAAKEGLSHMLQLEQQL